MSKVMKKLIKIAINDFRLIFRDKSLCFFFIFPLINLLVVRYGFVFIIEKFAVLNDYVSILLMAATTQGSLIFGFIYSMVLIDEKDTNVAKIYDILPVSKFWFVIFRLIAPFLFSTLATFLMLLFEPFYKISIVLNIIYSIIIGLIAPIMVLFVALKAKNKIEGMTLQKLFNLPVSLPLLAFFIPASFSFLFVIFPTHWAFQGFSNIITDKNFTLYFAIGFVYSLSLVVFLASRFTKNE